MFTADYMAVKGVLRVCLSVRVARAEHAVGIGLVIREKYFLGSWAVKAHQAQAIIHLQILQRFCSSAVGFEHHRARERRSFPNRRFRSRHRGPRPGVSKPQMRKNMQHGVIRAPIERLDAYADVLGIRLGILNEDIEIAVVIENARIEQLELRTLSGAAAG